MISIDINRLTLNLHGVSAQLAEQAVSDLEKELQRRLGVLSTGDLANYDTAELSIGPIHSTTQMDAAALRSLLVDRLVEQLQQHTMEGGA